MKFLLSLCLCSLAATCARAADPTHGEESRSSCNCRSLVKVLVRSSIGFDPSRLLGRLSLVRFQRDVAIGLETTNSISSTSTSEPSKNRAVRVPEDEKGWSTRPLSLFLFSLFYVKLYLPISLWAADQSIDRSTRK